MAYNPLSFQLYLNSANATYIENTLLRNKFGMTLNEPIVVPDDYVMSVSLVTAEVPINWTLALPFKYLLLGTNLQSRNQYMKGRYIAKIPKTVGSGFRLLYNNFTNYKHPVSDRKVDYIEVGLYAEDETNLNFVQAGTNPLPADINWSLTLQFDFHKK
jgi:hypothetical protein